MTKSLNDVEWKEFKIIEVLSNSYNAKPYHTNELFEDNNNKAMPYITRTNLNNGLYCTVKNNENYCKNPPCSISFGAENATYFFQPFEYITGNKMYYYKTQKLNKYICLFITCCLNKAIKNCGFGYGMGLTGNRSDKRKIMLPIDKKNEPDYEFMEEYIKERENKLKEKYKKYVQNRIKELAKFVDEEKEWKVFRICNIFQFVQRGKRLIKENQQIGKCPYISSSSLNNGVDNFIGNNVNVRKYKNCLSLANSGSVGSCFYEPFEFIASDHITHLKGNYSKYTYLFLANMLKRLSQKYNFNREINDIRINKEKILLPINSENEPDYDYMEKYIKYLEQKKILKYLDFIK